MFEQQIILVGRMAIQTRITCSHSWEQRREQGAYHLHRLCSRPAFFKLQLFTEFLTKCAMPEGLVAAQVYREELNFSISSLFHLMADQVALTTRNSSEAAHSLSCSSRIFHPGQSHGSCTVDAIGGWGPYRPHGRGERINHEFTLSHHSVTY